MQIIISCGGGGTRLWPVSTEEHPKQLIPLLDNESLLLKTYNNLRKAFATSQIWITVNKNHLPLVKSILPSEFDETHIIVEPLKRDTFAAIAIASAIIANNTSKEEPLIFVPSDDYIQNPLDVDILNQALQSIGESLQTKQFDVVTVGIKPKTASTQLGYLELETQQLNFGQVNKVVSFKEKPTKEIADKYLKSGNYLWHKHNPSLTYSSLIKSVELHYPHLLNILENIYLTGLFEIEDFLAFPKLAVDYAILERANKIGVMPLDIEWKDIGTWDTMFSLLPELNKQKQFQIDGENNKVKLTNQSLKVAFVGVSNLLVVQTNDGILILDPKNPGGVKNASEHFKGV